MEGKKNKIMDQKLIQKTIKRISYQIYETNSEENELVLAGIKENGLELATRIQKELKKISDLDVVLIKIKMDKKNPRDKISMSQPISFYENKSVVVVDDVLNTGRTLIYAVKKFLSSKLKKIQTAVLVNRNHKNFPIKGDFKGISLSTSIKEHINVRFGKDEGVYLS
jgi:pyrimidine operon attenuation protein/uracil phosphoribosyltransferase